MPDAENDAPVVLHKSRTGGRWFTHRGVIYSVTYGGPGWGYSVHSPSGVVVTDGYFTHAEVRAQVRRDLDARVIPPAEGDGS